MADQTPTPTPALGPNEGLRITDIAAWLLRTYVPKVVVAVLAFAAIRWHIVLDDNTSAQIVAGAVLAALAAYVGLARVLERVGGTGRVARAARWLGRWMLGGTIRQPVYAGPGERVRVLRADGTLRLPR
jgi:hypothetical protein